MAKPHKTISQRFRALKLPSINLSKQKPQTRISSGGKKKDLFGKQERSPEVLVKWWNIYKQGGMYSNAIDTYAYATFANGYRFEGKERFVKQVEQSFQLFDFDTVGMQGIIQSLVFGDSMQEMLGGRGGKPLAILMRDSSTFKINANEFGQIEGYTQVTGTGRNKKEKKLKPEQIVHLQLIPSGDLYGISLIGRAQDEIMRDTKTAEASAEAIDRHGFKKYHIKVGKEGELVKQEVIDSISTEFEDITTKNEFTTSRDVEIHELDEGGLEKIEDYNNISLMRVAAALGLPEEVMGIRRGSTDATAVARIEFFLKTKISAIQRTVARAYTLQYVDRVVPPGEVKLVFNDVSEEDEYKKAKWISSLITAYAQADNESLPTIEQIIPADWVQKQFDIHVKSNTGNKGK